VKVWVVGSQSLCYSGVVSLLYQGEWRFHMEYYVDIDSKSESLTQV
jgi:hypothetical protein